MWNCFHTTKVKLLLISLLFCYNGCNNFVQSQKTGGKCFETREELVKAVDEYVGDGESARQNVLTTYGESIQDWCVSAITDFSELFSGYRNPEVGDSFSEDLNGWDMSNAVTLKKMFQNAKVFEGNLNLWDVSKVTDMTGMFSGAENFNHDISSWQTGNVKHMENMFSHSDSAGFVTANPKFDQDIGSWDTSNVWSMKAMFAGATRFNQHLDKWNTTKVTNMKMMFTRAANFNGVVESWDTSSVADMSNMFHGAKQFNCGTSSYDDDKRGLNWDTSKVISMSSMFRDATSFVGGGGKNENAGIHKWDVRNVLDMSDMFNNANKFNTDLSGWELNKVTDISGMFYEDNQYSQNLCSWGHQIRERLQSSSDDIVYLDEIFTNTACPSSSSSGVDPEIDFTLSNGFCVESCSVNGSGNTGTASSAATTTNEEQKQTQETKKTGSLRGETTTTATNAGTTSTNNNQGCFETRDELINAVDIYLKPHVLDDGSVDAEIMEQKKEITSKHGNPMNAWCVSKITNFSELFNGLRNKNTGETMNEDLSSWDMSNAVNCKKMFTATKIFDQDISNWDVSKVTDMTSMFSGAESFTGSSKLGNWDVSSVKHMENMFSHAPNQKKYSFNDPSINNWDVSSVWSMKAMFAGSAIFNSNLNNWDTKSVTNMRSMFADASAFNGDVSTWNTSNVVDMSSMFHNAKQYNSGLEQEQLLNWDTSKVKTMVSMFQNAINFNSESVAQWDVSNVRDMNNMFQNANAFNVDLSSWDIGKVTDMSKMFKDAWFFRKDLCNWGHILRRRKEAMMSNDSSKREEQEDYDVYLHSIFIDSSCEKKIDPKIDETLSRGFCVAHCETEDEYLHHSMNKPNTPAPVKKTKLFGATEILDKKKSSDADVAAVENGESNSNLDGSEKKHGSFVMRFVYITAAISVLVFGVRRFAPKPKRDRGSIVGGFPRQASHEFRDEMTDEFQFGHQLPVGLVWNNNK